jgi:MFS family permease
MMLAPSRTRFGVLYFGVTLAVIQYIDRVCIAQAMPDIRAELGITGAQYDNYVGYVFSAFALAYALFEIPTGWLGDRFGPRKTLMRVVVWWSLFTPRRDGCGA